MADLLLPLFVIIIMFILIDAIDTIMPLMFMGFSFLPVSWIFVQQINNGAYTLLFGATVADYVGVGFMKMMGMIMFFVPLMAFVKMFYLRTFIAEEKDKNEEANEWIS